jgi:hypothetical protein
MGIAALTGFAFDPARDRSVVATSADHTFFTGLMNPGTGSFERDSSF